MKLSKNKRDVMNAGGFYKGYDIEWLRREPSHPDYHLVAEFDALPEDSPAAMKKLRAAEKKGKK